MAVYFVDSWFFIAYLDEADNHYHQVRRLVRRLVGDRLVTHDAVLTEVLAYFSGAGAHARREAVDVARNAMRQFDMKAVDRPLFLRALDCYAARFDKEYSHVDCISMIVMEDYGIQDVLTNDHHFAQAGFTVINE